MKKVFYSFVAAAMFAGVISCGNTEETTPVTEEAAVEETVEIPAEEVIVNADEATIVTEEAPVEAAPAQ